MLSMLLTDMEPLLVYKLKLSHIFSPFHSKYFIFFGGSQFTSEKKKPTRIPIFVCIPFFASTCKMYQAEYGVKLRVCYAVILAKPF